MLRMKRKYITKYTTLAYQSMYLPSTIRDNQGQLVFDFPLFLPYLNQGHNFHLVHIIDPFFVSVVETDIKKTLRRIQPHFIEYQNFKNYLTQFRVFLVNF